MLIKGVDEELCIGCGKCVDDCPAALFAKEDKKKVTFSDPIDACIKCGHCIAICPTSAILYEDAEDPLEDTQIARPNDILSYEKLMVLLRARRSLRHFKNKPVQKEDISKVLEAMRYAPNGSNAEAWEYIVITDPKRIDTFSGKVVDWMRPFKRLIRNKLLIKLFTKGQLRKNLLHPRTAVGYQRIIDRRDSSEDPIFFHAPCVIILHSPGYGSLAGNDAGLAFMHGMLAAQSLGLGTCWIGFAQEAARRKKDIRRWLGVPEGRNVSGIMILGYPSIRYKRAPPRKPIRAVWQ